MSETRWPCHAESCQALINKYTKIIEALESIICVNSQENVETNENTQSLIKKCIRSYKIL